MKKILLFAILITLSFVFTKNVGADGDLPGETFYKATVTQIVNYGETITEADTRPFQVVRLKILDGENKDLELEIRHGENVKLTNDQLVKQGETVVLVKTYGPNNEPFFIIADKYRLNSIIPVILAFFLIIIILSRWKGLGSIVGMAISLAVILQFIIPQILAGRDPLTVSIIGCLFIMITTIYLAHGFSARTSIAVIATFITLVGTGILSVILVKTTSLTGLGSEDANALRFGVTSTIDFKGLLLGGILIGTLGVLDDITTSLSAAVFELKKANSAMKFGQLFNSGLEIGKEHISSLVNTLVLAYAGAALPIFLVINLNINSYPLWSILNDGLIMEEVVRTLAGSLGLIAAVPLTTFIAAYWAARTT